MRTTLDLPEGLLAAAQRACGARTKTMTVVMALQQLVSAAKIAQLRALRGKVRLNVDLKELPGERVAGTWPVRRR
ncbi:MAG: type II toxin-antitoxin system VapB family antitoxin [Candidatus Rokubacteria bacterium]|nr:type II toxin-antitoxin system VapB family antitoxin [Candidatus Rokubacteria bacterium]MBI3457557.1 type II toxin-antitoxin system VapB family antitoxin [Candidatus Rokubacteria bacterium]